MGKDLLNPTIRILMLGSAGVGKNCLESRFTTKVFPPPYNPALTLNSRRFFSLAPEHVAGDGASMSAGGRHNEPVTDKESVAVLSGERPITAWSMPGRNASRRGDPTDASNNGDAVNDGTAQVTTHVDDSMSLDVQTLVHAEVCAECARENSTYLVEVINYPELQSAGVRSHVHACAEYDAVMLVYDVTDPTSFDAVTALHAEIPARPRKSQQHHHRRKAGPHAGGAQSRAGGWFGGGGGGAYDETATVRSGEVVVGLVGNKSDCDGDDHDSQDDAAGGGANASSSSGPLLQEKAAMQAEVDFIERSLLHPLYRESIMYEELMAEREEKERRAAAAKAAKAIKAARSETKAHESVPNTPFPVGIIVGASPMSLRGTQPSGTDDAGESQDIQRWLQISSTSTLRPAADSVELSAENRGTIAPSSSSVQCVSQDLQSPRSDDDDIPWPTTAPDTAKLRRAISTDAGVNLAQTLRLAVPFVETSAKTGAHVEQAFENLVREVLRKKGHDTSGTKVSKTCRHRAAGGSIVLMVPERLPKEKQLQQASAHNHSRLQDDTPLESPLPLMQQPQPRAFVVEQKTAVAAEVTLDGAGNTVDRDSLATASVIDSRRPQSADMFEKSIIDDLQPQEPPQNDQNDAVSDAIRVVPMPAPPPPTVLRENVLGRMKRLFVRRSQPLVVLPSDIVV